MFRKKIKQESDNYEIRTTANNILNQFHSETSLQKKKHFNFKPIFAFSTSLVIIGSVLFIINNNDNDNNNSNNNTQTNNVNPIINKKYTNIISLEVASSLEIIENYSSPLITPLSKNNIDQTTFEDICNNFANNYETLNKSLSFKNNYEYQIENGEFTIDNSTYSYKITIEDNKYLYYSIDSKSNDKTTKEIYNGILEIDNNIYQMSGKRKINSNNNEDEIDISIILNENTTLNIEQETERSEYSYSYSLIENHREIYELEIDFEKDEIEMECFENQKEYEYEIQIIDSTYSIEYQYSKSNLEIEGLMSLTIDENTKEMTFQDKNNSLIYKKYQ